MSKLPHATVFADASLCPRTHAAGWGAWMISRARPSLMHGGPLRGLYASSLEAELAALTNALHVAAKSGFLAEGATIMLQSDSTGALGFIRHHFGAEDRPMADRAGGIPVPVSDPKCWTTPRGKRGRRAKADPKWDARMDQRRRLLAAIQARVTADQLRLVVRHVKGHRNRAATEGDGRAWVNVQVDRLAREGMLAARKVLRGEDA